MPSEPVSENILADLKSTFEGITADATTWTTVRKAYIGDGVPVAEHVEPAVYITATYTDMDGEGETLVEAIRHILFVEAKLILRTRDENESTQRERFIYHKNLQPVFNDLVRFLGTEVGNEADAACIVLIGRVIKALLSR